MNSVLLIGRLTKDPELRYTPTSNMAVTRFTLAVDRPKQGAEEKNADFIQIKVFGKQAENCEKYLAKGRQVAVQGHIYTGSYDKHGETVYTTEIVAERVEFLGNKETIGNREKTPEKSKFDRTEAFVQERHQFFEDVEEDLPF